MPSFTVEADGQTIAFEAPANASEAQIRTLAARALKKASPGKQYQTPVLETGLMDKLKPRTPKIGGDELKAAPDTLAGRISDKISGALSWAGMNERQAAQWGDKFTGALSDFTPVGAATSGDDARRAWTEGRYLDAGGNALLSMAAVVPEGKALGKGAREALTGWHGSPLTELTSVLAAPPSRQFDNATSQFGAFFAPNEAGAQRYAGQNGRIYKTQVPLKNPYEMDWAEFAKFQAPEKAADGSRVPGEGWAARNAELMQEAKALRAQLEQAGHDGVIIRGPRGDIKEIASFSDVPIL